MSYRSKRLVKAALNSLNQGQENDNTIRRFIPPKKDFKESIKFNNEVFNEIMSNKNHVLDNNNININYDELIDSLTDLSRDTVDWLPPNERTKNNIDTSDTNSIDYIQNKPSCSRALAYDSTSLPHNNEACSEKTHVSESTEPEQLTFPHELIDSEESFQIDTSLLKKKNKKNSKTVKKLNRVSGAGKSVQTNPCKVGKCNNKCYEKFTEEEREQIFHIFWGLKDYQRQRDFLISCTNETAIKRKRTKNVQSRRNVTINYYLSYNSEPKKICQQFLLKTLDMSQKCMRYTVTNKTSIKTSPKDNRGKGIPKNKTSEDNLRLVNKFIQSLPVVPSHYCRSSSNKKYLSSDISNASRLYLIYKDFCSTNGYNAVSKRVFLNIFHDKYNIGFHKPKKDKCRLCMRFENLMGPITSQDHECLQKHQAEKEKCKEMFLFDQQLSKAMGNFCCTSFDLQKVLNTPYAPNVMNLYYSRKYSFYNCTLYESGSQNAFAYLWGEMDGQRGSNEIVTSIYKYLNKVDMENKITSIALYRTE